MAELKRRILTLSSGKQLKLYGESIAISKSMEIGEGSAPNIFSFNENQSSGKPALKINNPHGLTPDELFELADFNMQLWMEFKTNIRKYGMDNPKIFNREVPSSEVKKAVVNHSKKAETGTEE